MVTMSPHLYNVTDFFLYDPDITIFVYLAHDIK